MYRGATPVLFLIFNRPDKTQRVFDEIRKAKPQQLFIAADGPRPHMPGEAEKCQITRKIIDQIDWDCQVETLFRDQNLGCGEAVSSAIDWFFDQAEEGIILEDDCLPHPSFFYFCQEMLNRYRDDTRVMHVGGSNFQFGQVRGDGSYYFSRVVNVWGWATWRRAWALYDFNIKSYPELLEKNILNDIFCSKKFAKSFRRTFGNVYHGIWDNWDQQWIYTLYSNNGLSVIPNKNLISNIGFGADASADYHENDRYINMPTEEIAEIVPPTFMVPNREADEYYHNKVFTHPPLPRRIKRKIKRLITHQ